MVQSFGWLIFEENIPPCYPVGLKLGSSDSPALISQVWLLDNLDTFGQESSTLPLKASEWVELWLGALKRNPEVRRFDQWCGRARKIDLELAFRAGMTQPSYPGQNLPSHKQRHCETGQESILPGVQGQWVLMFPKVLPQNCCLVCHPSLAILTTFKVKSYPQLYEDHIWRAIEDSLRWGCPLK